MKKLSLLLLILIISFSSLQLSAQDTLTVADGTNTNNFVPFFGLGGDYYNRSQMMFPDSLLGNMVGGDIHSLTFYLATTPTDPWTSVFDVKLGISSETLCPNNAYWTAPTLTFYTGTMTVVANRLTINFASPCPYFGGNLLVEFATQTPGNKSHGTFYGINSIYSSIKGGDYNSLSSITPVSILPLGCVSFMPKTTFVYTPSSLSCPKPDTFTVSDISAHEALLTWSSGGNETSWDIYVTETDLFPDSSITPTVSVTDTSYNLTALNPTTDYHAYIRANCGSEQSNWKGLSFHTLCDSITALPFVENFDTYGTDNYPECWSKLKNNTILVPCISNICYNGGGSLRLSTNESGAYHIAITPTIAQYIPVNILQATFKFRGFYSTDRLIVGVISDPSNATTFVPIDTVYPGTPASTWVERTVIFSSYTGIGQYIAFKNEYNTTNTNTFIDNLTIDLAPNCPRPQYVTLNNITADGCDVSWTPMGSENTWEIVAVPAGATAGSGTPVTASSNPFTLTNLLDETQYDVYVRANCGGTYSDWSLSVTFTTNPLCTSALNVNVSQVAGASALVTWDDALYGATNYKVGYSEIGQNNWTAQSVTGNHFLLSGLMPMTTYDVMVLSECPLGNADTVFVQFSTICLAGGNVQIGNDNVAHQGIPINCYWPYSMTEQIFLATEMSGPATIDSIAFEYVSEYPSTGKDSVNIYLGHTTQSSFTNSDDYVPDSILQLVYTGHLNCQHGWNTFPFDVPFYYNGTDNLVLVVDDNSGDSSWVIRQFSVHDAGGYRTVYYYTDNETNNPEPSNPLYGNPIDYFCRERSNVRFFIPCDSTLSCIAPNAYLSYVGKDSLTITWAPGNMESSWEMQYCTDTANWVSLGLVTSPYTIDNLTFDTKYIVRLRAVCGNGDFSDWTTLEVRTPCSYISIPYYEDFEEGPEFGSANMIPCWTAGSIYSQSSHLYPFNISHSGSCSVSFNNYAYLATPPFTSETDMQHLRIRFWAMGPGWGYATIPYCIQVGVMTDPDDPNTFVQVAQTYPSTSYTWQMLEVTTSSYTGNGQYIAFRTPQYTIGADIYIDDISIDAICPQVLNITIDTASLTSNSANLTWTAGGDETEWEVVYGLADSIINPDLESPTMVSDTPSIMLNGLMPGATYILFVKAICSPTDSSTWAQYTFNTVPVVFYETGCESFEWNGTTYTASGEYTYSHTDANGSTQVDTLHLTIIHGTDSILTVTACDSFYWHGVTYYESNDSATFDTITVAGCDSTVTLHLTVNHSVTELIEATTDDSCYAWNSETYCSSGDYTQTFQTIYGCDSTVTLHLTITVDVEDHDFASSLIVYPNPTTDIVNVQCAMRNEWVEALEIQLFDAFGRLLDVVEAPLTSSQQTAQINLSHLAKGVYFMKAMADGKVRTVRKVVKQ